MWSPFFPWVRVSLLFLCISMFETLPLRIWTSSMPCGDLVSQFWVFTSCGLWAGEGWRNWSTHRRGTWSSCFVCLFVFPCFWHLMFSVPWYVWPRLDLACCRGYGHQVEPATNLLRIWSWTRKPQPALLAEGGLVTLAVAVGAWWQKWYLWVCWVFHLWPLVLPLHPHPASDLHPSFFN